VKTVTSTKKQETVPEPVVHPLVNFVPTFKRSFEEWKQAWQATTDQYAKLGLLYELGESFVDRQVPEAIIFLLELADGYTYADNFKTVKDPNYTWSDDYPRNRQALAKKAKKILCTKLFLPSKYDDASRFEWWWIIFVEKVYNKILWFLIDRGNIIFYPADKDFESQNLIEFTRQFCRLHWTFSVPNDDESYKLALRRLQSNQPRCIGLLMAIRELYWLKPRRDLSKACRKELRRLALADNLSYPVHESMSSSANFRKPRNLKEALFGGSSAAEVLILEHLKLLEGRRFTKRFTIAKAKFDEDLRQKKLAELKIKEQQLRLERQKLCSE
jgi:hypothetical protein